MKYESGFKQDVIGNDRLKLKWTKNYTRTNICGQNIITIVKIVKNPGYYIAVVRIFRISRRTHNLSLTYPAYNVSQYMLHHKLK